MRAIEGSRGVGHGCLSQRPEEGAGVAEATRKQAAGETGAPTHRQGCFPGALCSAGSPSEPTPLISGFCPPLSLTLGRSWTPWSCWNCWCSRRPGEYLPGAWRCRGVAPSLRKERGRHTPLSRDVITVEDFRSPDLWPQEAFWPGSVCLGWSSLTPFLRGYCAGGWARAGSGHQEELSGQAAEPPRPFPHRVNAERQAPLDPL